MDTAVRKSDGFMEHVEEAEKGSQSTPQYDQFGSTAKVDPKEIRLVRKLDAYMMVSLIYLLEALDDGSPMLTRRSQSCGSCTFSTFSIATPW